MSTDASVISVECSGCGKRFSVAVQHAGKRGKCKACGAMVAIPRPAQPAQEDDLYDFAPGANVPASAPQPALQPQAPAVAPPVLAYSRPAPKRAGQAARFDPSDPFEGNKVKNLYLPLGLIAGTALFNFLTEGLSSHNATVGMVAASVQMVIKLVVEIPVMLIACLLAVKFLDAAFGPLGPAIIKLSAIALVPDAAQDLIILAAYVIGHASGNPRGIPVDTMLGAIIGWVLSLIVYFRLFMYFFDLELGEAYRLIIFVWFVRLFLGWLLIMVVLSYFMH
jgi:hypothetical protein